MKNKNIKSSARILNSCHFNLPQLIRGKKSSLQLSDDIKFKIHETVILQNTKVIDWIYYD